MNHEIAESYCRVLAPEKIKGAYDVFQGGVFVNRNKGTLSIYVRQAMSLEKYSKVQREQLVSIHYCNVLDSDS